MASPVMALGLMSGTSVDGSVSAAIIKTDGEDQVTRVANYEHTYEDATGARPLHHLIKAAEIAYRDAAGNQAAAAAGYASALSRYMSALAAGSLGGGTGGVDALVQSVLNGGVQITLADVVERSTQAHIAAAMAILKKTGVQPSEISYIGYHGQTVYHDPFFNKVTIQIGDAQLFADQLRVPVVCDFRLNDLALGGQGAPLAPVYHRALLRSAGIRSAAFLNLGGTANLTVAGSSTDDLLGFDTGPANGLIDRYVKERLGLALDRDSKLANQGRVSEAALARLIEGAIVLKDGRNFLDLPPPKSLDIRDYTFSSAEFDALSVEDGCATLNAFTAECIARGVDWIRHLGLEVPTEWFTCGGGVFSPHLQAQILERLKSRIPDGLRIRSADTMGWSAQGMEAELFAYLAVRSVRKLPITFPTTTGVRQPATAGRTVMPQLL
jgi:anhydro-N-acetylmuramic acid kinase